MSVKYWPLVPAAGVGSRMQTDKPKQYLTLANQLLIDHTLNTLLSYPAFSQLVLILSATDPYWPQSRFYQDSRLVLADGGHERCYSVLNGLDAISHLAQADDWVLVHDVARPCLHHQDLDVLIAACATQGGILATPVRDSMKRGHRTPGGQQVLHSVERDQLWHALTPQMFRYAELKQALTHCLEMGFEVTDEASAMEYCQQPVQLIEGRADNIKVTRPADLNLAAFFLSHAATI